MYSRKSDAEVDQTALREYQDLRKKGLEERGTADELNEFRRRVSNKVSVLSCQ